MAGVNVLRQRGTSVWEPHVVTLSGRKVVLCTGGTDGEQFAFLPTVAADGKITLEVDVAMTEASLVGAEKAQTPQHLHHIRGSGVLKDGQTLVVITPLELGKKGSLVFGIWDHFASWNIEPQADVLLLVTPHIIDPMSCRQSAN
jgi:hypothetical protein